MDVALRAKLDLFVVLWDTWKLIQEVSRRRSPLEFYVRSSQVWARPGVKVAAPESDVGGCFKDHAHGSVHTSYVQYIKHNRSSYIELRTRPSHLSRRARRRPFAP